MKTQIVCSTYSLGKHWQEVLNVFIGRAIVTNQMEPFIEEMNQWRHDRMKGPRDSIGYPGQSAKFVIKDGECRVYFEYNDPKKKPKLMAKAWVERSSQEGDAAL